VEDHATERPEAVDSTSLGVEARQVVVHGDDVDALISAFR
jgi:hypothetical protein